MNIDLELACKDFCEAETLSETLEVFSAIWHAELDNAVELESTVKNLILNLQIFPNENTRAKDKIAMLEGFLLACDDMKKRLV